MSGPGASRFEVEKKQARIEIIPLIDVIFFLLATFVLFTLSLEKIKSVPVNLPVPAPPTSIQEKNDDDVTLQISDLGNVYWNKDLMPMAELPGRIQAYKESVANPRILIAGDDNAKFGPTVEVLDLVRKSGITQVSVETSTRPTGK